LRANKHWRRPGLGVGRINSPHLETQRPFGASDVIDKHEGRVAGACIAQALVGGGHLRWQAPPSEPDRRHQSFKNADMKDWNVVVTAYDARSRRAARRALRAFGEIAQSEFFNVLVMRVPDVAKFVEDFAAFVAENLDVLN